MATETTLQMQFDSAESIKWVRIWMPSAVKEERGEFMVGDREMGDGI
jgi:hypothetical protein